MPTKLLQLAGQQYGLFLLFLLLLLSASEAQASHLRAGDITAKRDTTPNPNPFRFFFRMVLYTDRASQADDLTVTIFYGDGITQTVPRGPVRQISPETDQGVFTWEHTFPANGTYKIEWIGVNRNGRILNVAAPSDAHSFYLTTTININAFRGLNSTPVLRYPPIDVAAVGKKWMHNPAAYDADGDSLSFKLIPPRRKEANSDRIIPVPGYVLPNMIRACQNSGGTTASTFTLDPATGQMEWDAPCLQGDYVVAYVVEEWRKTPAGVVKMGEVVHDMLISVKESPNTTPVLFLPKDTCIVAGTTLNASVRATDQDGDPLSLTAISEISPLGRLTLQTGSPSTNGLAAGAFSWTPTCADVRSQPYQVVFRAEDRRPNQSERLVNLQPWNIRVVAPPPQNLTVTGTGNQTLLTWDRYTCPNAAAIRIYRREGPGNFVPDKCGKGVSASTGYTLVAEVAKDATFFTDAGSNAALPPLRGYCYLLEVVFPSPGNGRSVVTAETCGPGRVMSSEAEMLEHLVQVYPNPAQGRLHVEMPGNTTWDNLRLYSITGKLLLEMRGKEKNNISIELPQLATGFHLLQVQTSKGIVTKRVLLE